MTGPTGAPGGATGPTGPFGTGPTGPTGPSNVQGLAAYGHAVGTATNTIDANVDVAFSQGGLAFPHTGIIPPAPGGSVFTILTDGDYVYDFHVVGSHDNAATTSLEFALFLNGVSPGAAHEFRSNQQASAADVQIVWGHGIISIAAGTSVTIRNRTEIGTAKVNVTTAAPGGETSANCTLSLMKLSA
jgi:hypothetical protein